MWNRIKSHLNTRFKRSSQESDCEPRQCQVKIKKNEEVELPDFEVEDLEVEVLSQIARSESVMSIRTVSYCIVFLMSKLLAYEESLFWKFVELWDSFKGRSYVRIHLAIFVMISLVGALIIWGIEIDHSKMNFLDALFTATSANCVTGLTSVNFSEFQVESQVVTLVLIFCGGQIVTMVPIIVAIRKRTKHSDPETWTALGHLIVVVLFYNFGLQGLAFLILGGYMSSNESLQGGINPWWFSIFHTTSAFNNAGFSLYPDNLVRFQTDYLVCLVTAFLIVFGYTGFPIALRFTLYLLSKIPFLPSQYYKNLLSRNRSLFGHLLPSTETKFLIVMLICMNIVGTTSSVGLDWNSEPVKHLSGGHKVFVFFFNDICTRTAGFNSIDLGATSVASLLVTIVLMYISSYPVGLKVAHHSKPRKLLGHIAFIAKKILFRHNTWLVIAIFCICSAEENKLRDDPNFTFFKILFEVVSAFGTVGLTLGYPGSHASFSGQLSGFSKLVLICVMIMGRHRKLHRALLDSMDEVEHHKEESAEEIILVV